MEAKFYPVAMHVPRLLGTNLSSSTFLPQYSCKEIFALLFVVSIQWSLKCFSVPHLSFQIHLHDLLQIPAWKFCPNSVRSFAVILPLEVCRFDDEFEFSNIQKAAIFVGTYNCFRVLRSMTAWQQHLSASRYYYALVTKTDPERHGWHTTKATETVAYTYTKGCWFTMPQR